MQGRTAAAPGLSTARGCRWNQTSAGTSAYFISTILWVAVKSSAFMRQK